ncbi:MAG TPA: DedA family protein [Actinomycetota bacterium]|nr:DedA family protein [Actinomycetota bacterium]
MAHLVDSLKTWVVNFIPHGAGGYAAILLLMVLESACIPIPSEITMPVGGLLVSQGDLNLILLIAVGVLGNLIGSLASYAVGRSGGRSLLERYGRYILVKPHDIERADAWFARHGPPAVFFSRLLPVLRTFISLPAGVSRMDVKRFTVLTVLGCIPWVAVLAIAGDALGRHWSDVLTYTRPLEYVVIAGAVIAAGFWLFRRARAANTAA